MLSALGPTLLRILSDELELALSSNYSIFAVIVDRPALFCTFQHLTNARETFLLLLTNNASTYNPMHPMQMLASPFQIESEFD